MKQYSDLNVLQCPTDIYFHKRHWEIKGSGEKHWTHICWVSGFCPEFFKETPLKFPLFLLWTRQHTFIYLAFKYYQIGNFFSIFTRHLYFLFLSVARVYFVCVFNWDICHFLTDLFLYIKSVNLSYLLWKYFLPAYCLSILYILFF